MTQTKAVTATGDEVVVSEDGVEDLKALLMWYVFRFILTMACLTYRPMLAAGDCEIKE